MHTVFIDNEGSFINEATGQVITASPGDKYTYDMTADVWADARTLDAARADKTRSLSIDCANQILEGFDSAALGTVHHYPAKPLDQANLVASVLDSLLMAGDAEWATAFWCADTLGVWGFRLHTAAQIQTVGQTGKASILAAMSKNEALAHQVSLATSIKQVDAIQWAEAA